MATVTAVQAEPTWTITLDAREATVVRALLGEFSNSGGTSPERVIAGVVQEMNKAGLKRDYAIATDAPARLVEVVH